MYDNVWRVVTQAHMSIWWVRRVNKKVDIGLKGIGMCLFILKLRWTAQDPPNAKIPTISHQHSFDVSSVYFNDEVADTYEVKLL